MVSHEKFKGLEKQKVSHVNKIDNYLKDHSNLAKEGSQPSVIERAVRPTVQEAPAGK